MGTALNTTNQSINLFINGIGNARLLKLFFWEKTKTMLPCVSITLLVVLKFQLCTANSCVC